MRVVVEAERLGQSSVLGLRGRRPNCVKVDLMRMHPQQAGEEVQALRRKLLELTESNAVSNECGDDIRVGIRKRMLRIRPQQQGKRCLGRSCHYGHEEEEASNGGKRMVRRRSGLT